MTRKIKNLIKDFGISSFNYSGGMQFGEGVSEEMLTTKGDTHGYTTENARVPIGTNDQVLTADSTTALGLVWKTSGGGVEYSQLTTSTTFTPTTQTGLVKVTVDSTDMTNGNIDVNVDGSSIQNIASGEFENRVVNPTTSLSIITNAGGYGLSTASYDGVSLSVASQDTQPRGITFKSDGTKMYMIGATNDSVYQYSLSTVWDLSTASYDSVSLSIGSQDVQPTGVTFRTDGTKMYMIGYQTDSIHQYTLSTAWDLSTGSYDGVSLSVASQDTIPNGLFFKSDGTKMYIVGQSSDRVFQYSLSTAWNMSTASYDSVSLYVGSQDGTPQGLFFKSDGTKMYMVGSTSDKVYQYSLSTAWDMSTASYDSVSFSVASQDSEPHDIAFKSDGTKMYMAGNTTDKIFQYSTSSTFAGTARISIG